MEALSKKVNYYDWLVIICAKCYILNFQTLWSRPLMQPLITKSQLCKRTYSLAPC